MLQILNGKFSSVVTAAAKAKGWDDVAREVSAVSRVFLTPLMGVYTPHFFGDTPQRRHK